MFSVHKFVQLLLGWYFFHQHSTMFICYEHKLLKISETENKYNINVIATHKSC